MNCHCRYEERLKYIHSIVDKKLKLSFEDFSQSIIQPLDSVQTAAMASVAATFSHGSPLPVSSSQPTPSAGLTSTSSLHHLQPASSPAAPPPRSPRASPRGTGRTSLLKLPGHVSGPLDWLAAGSPPVQRERANTNEERRSRQGGWRGD